MTSPCSGSACGALFALVTLGLAQGAALIAGGRRLPTLVRQPRSGWPSWPGRWPTCFDYVHYSPTGLVGTIPLWPLEFEPLALIAAVVAVVAVVVGIAGLGGISLEAAERRTRLVGQLRFAATLQDLRTVMVLRRQLAMELPRTRPWIREHSSGRLPVWHRGMRGVLRWPAGRIVRLVSLGVVAGIALRGVADGTIPLMLLAGGALYVAALDGVESMAQEADHPGRSEALPRPIGDLLVRHLGVGALVMTFVALVGAGVAVAMDPSLGAAGVAAIAVAPAALAAAAGGALSVLQGIQEPSAGWDLIPPEVAGMRTAFRVGGPPVVAVIGVLPVVMARSAVDNGGDPFASAATAAVLALIVTGLVAGWIHQREQIKAWFRALQDEAGMAAPRADVDPGDRVRLDRHRPGPGHPQARPHQGDHDPAEEAMTKKAPKATPLLCTYDLTKRYGEVDALLPARPGGRRRASGSCSWATTARARAPCCAWSPACSTPATARSMIAGDPAGSLEARAVTSFLPDEPVLYDDLSVREHVDYIGRLHGTDGYDDAAADAAERLGIAHRIDDLPARFSRGLRQKTALLLGLIRPFDLLLVDEPFVGLDLAGKAALVELLEETPPGRGHLGRGHPRPRLRRPGRPLHRPARRRGHLRRPGQEGRHHQARHPPDPRGRPSGAAGRRRAPSSLRSDLDDDRERLVDDRVVAELTVEVVAPAADLAGREQGAGVIGPPDRPRSRPFSGPVSPTLRTTLGRLVSGVIVLLPIWPLSPSPQQRA